MFVLVHVECTLLLPFTSKIHVDHTRCVIDLGKVKLRIYIMHSRVVGSLTKYGDNEMYLSMQLQPTFSFFDIVRI